MVYLLSLAAFTLTPMGQNQIIQGSSVHLSGLRYLRKIVAMGADRFGVVKSLTPGVSEIEHQQKWLPETNSMETPPMIFDSIRLM